MDNRRLSIHSLAMLAEKPLGSQSLQNKGKMVIKRTNSQGKSQCITTFDNMSKTKKYFVVWLRKFLETLTKQNFKKKKILSNEAQSTEQEDEDLGLTPPPKVDV